MRDPAFEPSEKTQRALAAPERRRAAGERGLGLVKSMALVLAGTVLLYLVLWAFAKRFLAIGVLLLAVLLLPGCQSAQVAEADVYKALVYADEGVTWAAGHEAEIKLAVQVAMGVDPKNATLQSAGQKAITAIDKGDLGAAMAFVRSARIVFSPAPLPAPPKTP